MHITQIKKWYSLAKDDCLRPRGGKEVEVYMRNDLESQTPMFDSLNFDKDYDDNAHVV